MLIVALVIGGGAALAARSYLNRQMASIEAKAKGSTVTAIVAKGDIPKGTRLSAENMALRPIPVEFAHSVAVTPDDFERIDGQVLAYPVKSGEMIMWGLLETQKVPTFSARVETGRRAMTVPVDEINSISGMLEPGDTIDLMVSLDREGKKFTFPLLQSVDVMATGQRSEDDPKGGEPRQYTTVTVNTSPAEARQLIAAREMGKLTALLRNPQDKGPFDEKRYDVAGLLGLDGQAPRIKATGGRGPRRVAVIYGGPNVSNLPPEALRLARAASPAPEPAPAAVPPATAP
ncbi:MULTISPECIES: Flp pilus assembly protein CpaB [unclassified Massilia]|uniref:Flp pilus assembly protein CpaB n=1 Tax=unclassified Massilia TaxID=2609279 RepID=UPI001E5F5F49|nr:MULTISPECIES: Flp pilus assembly protein CpaB [unclassified Massilia]